MSNKGVAIISIDYEYAWGYRDTNLSEGDLARVRREVEITKELLALFEKYNIKATWAIVGKLLVAGVDSVWSDVEGLIPHIQSSQVGHEIASHSYGHVLYGHISYDEAGKDAACAHAIHAQYGYPFTSFVFPRNSEGHHDVLKKAGIRCFREDTLHWYTHVPGILKRVGHFIDHCLPIARTGFVSTHTSGLVSIPASMLFVGRNGLRRCIPGWMTFWKVKRGLNKAIKRGELFHLWFHPSNFSYQTKKQIRLFEKILSYIESRAGEGALEVRTMQEYVH